MKMFRYHIGYSWYDENDDYQSTYDDGCVSGNDEDEAIAKVFNYYAIDDDGMEIELEDYYMEEVCEVEIFILD